MSLGMKWTWSINLCHPLLFTPPLCKYTWPKRTNSGKFLSIFEYDLLIRVVLTTTKISKIHEIPDRSPVCCLLPRFHVKRQGYLQDAAIATSLWTQFFLPCLHVISNRSSKFVIQTSSLFSWSRISIALFHSRKPPTLPFDSHYIPVHYCTSYSPTATLLRIGISLPMLFCLF